MKIMAVSGIKNSGKTTLICSLLPLLKQAGVHTAVIKHDGHDFEADVPGRDSYRYRENGAEGAAVFSSEKYMLTRQRAEEYEAEEKLLEELLHQFSDMDLVLLEGFKMSPFPKIEILRRENSVQSVCTMDTLRAVITDLPEEQLRIENPQLPVNLPVFDLNCPQNVVTWMVQYLDTDTDLQEAYGQNERMESDERMGHNEQEESDEEPILGRPEDPEKIWSHMKVVLAKDEDFFGPGVFRLLKYIAETGSIAAAAEKMQISYSKSWKMIQKVEKETGRHFVERVNGGKNGGSSHLTPEAELFVDRYEQMTRELRRVSESLFVQYFGDL